MGVKDENQTPPAGIYYPAFFASTRRGFAQVATAGAKRSAAPHQDRHWQVALAEVNSGGARSFSHGFKAAMDFQATESLMLGSIDRSQSLGALNPWAK